MMSPSGATNAPQDEGKTNAGLRRVNVFSLCRLSGAFVGSSHASAPMAGWRGDRRTQATSTVQSIDGKTARGHARRVERSSERGDGERGAVRRARRND